MPGPRLFTLFTRLTAAFIIIALIRFTYILRPRFVYKSNSNHKPVSHHLGNYNVHLVIASVSSDDTSWTHQFFPDWTSNVYVMDDADASLTVPKNKGRESAAYLTYIIDNYHNLPDFMIFLHGSRFQWHNEDPLYDGVAVLNNLRFSYVKRHGFATLRCTWKLGCPRELQAKPGMGSRLHRLLFATDRDQTEAAFPSAFASLFPELPLPEHVAIHCGAQFAATREKVQSRSLEDYIRYRNWLWSTTLPDNLSGRVFEYMWHIVMGMPAVSCPDAGECFCQKFGLCDLSCAVHRCKKRYWFKFGVIPKGWPIQGTGKNGWPPRDWAE